ncbi:hypothetical protein PROFUN_05618 [Planoprotostelium fungivorum]|uniref:DNA topoisomerase n=1 Tax=Planoprotostelium fungivorum TaxID=1890364 RepID=A0A2P6MUD9_9EUKA|nr:hypothetical protein PROFUN_05618 [Planoprotostelium fungivorum]
MGQPTVLMVAEKPSIAKSISEILSKGQADTKKGHLPTHHFEGSFLSHSKGTSTGETVTSSEASNAQDSCDFPPEYQSWTTVDPATLFDAPTIKEESGKGMCRHLRDEGKDVDFLVLWMDCDREGENICYEVMENVLPKMSHNYKGQQTIFRAKFSAISESDIKRAMSQLVSPNEYEAKAVDARQEIDLKVGVAFTRFQTRYFQDKYSNLDASLLSYGPCQTPTLGFCVDRADEISSFQPEPFWTIGVDVMHNGRRAKLEWKRGRVFDHETGIFFEKSLSTSNKRAFVDRLEKKEAARPRPHPLNTVEMLKVASNQLGIGPKYAMIIAERLYIQGYPRTESTKYPSSFDCVTVLKTQTRSTKWGSYATSLLHAGINLPKSGHDAGDHPPITPVKDDYGLSGDDARLYDYIARHFIASISPDYRYEKTKAYVTIANEKFTVSGKKTKSEGYVAVMPWLTVKDEELPPFEQGKTYDVTSIELREGKTSPPEFLSESELISLMEKHGIGTDASIAVHINNICERNYVNVDGSRRLVPTRLGTTLVRGYHKIDPDIVLPTIRSKIEEWIGLIALGKADYETVVKHSLQSFSEKFAWFVSKINLMQDLFEASFTSLDKVVGTRLKCLCGKCRRYMTFFPLKPTRLYCQTCQETYSLPQNGSIKVAHSLYTGIQCPLDNFELVLFSFGSGQKAFPLCPFCYNHPSIEGMPEHSGCNNCPHPSCPHSFIQHSICGCFECDDGLLILDPASGPKWRADCNKCRYQLHLPSAHKIAVADGVCETCGSNLLDIDFNKNDTPLPNGETKLKGCIQCEPLLRTKVEASLLIISAFTTIFGAAFVWHQNVATSNWEFRSFFPPFVGTSFFLLGWAMSWLASVLCLRSGRRGLACVPAILCVAIPLLLAWIAYRGYQMDYVQRWEVSMSWALAGGIAFADLVLFIFLFPLLKN